MALDDVLDLDLQGTYCGVPISINLAYVQRLENLGDEDPARTLVDAWFNDANGPWQVVRPILSNALLFQCATVRRAGFVSQLFLDSVPGANDTPGTPSPLALQINIPAQFPHPASSAGRFYLPGIPANEIVECGVSTALIDQVEVFCEALMGVGLSAANPQLRRFVLIPHAKYVDANGGTADIHASRPHLVSFVKVVSSRRSDACTTFINSDDAGGFETIEVTPPSNV
jgi:hypothetical protein